MKQLILFLSILLSSIISNAQSTFVTTANVNMRSLPCTCAEISTVIPKGTTILVLNYEDESWARVSYNGHINYVSRRYIKPKNISSYKSQSSSHSPKVKRHNSGYSNSSNGVQYYTNSYGERVQSPTYYQTAPVGATALCRDGTYSFSRSRRGTCSHHGGVAKWL